MTDIVKYKPIFVKDILLEKKIKTLKFYDCSFSNLSEPKK